MSMIETVNDVKNSFLSRREITCTFAGVGGKLKKLDAIDMIKKEFKLDGKFIIPIIMKNHTGRPSITGTFYVYEDEELAKKQNIKQLWVTAACDLFANQRSVLG